MRSKYERKFENVNSNSILDMCGAKQIVRMFNTYNEVFV